MSINTTIKSGITSGHGTALLYTGMLGLILSDIVPTAADALYFSWERKLRDKWKAGEITPQQYWQRETLMYYGLNPIYWALIMLIVINVPGGASHKAKIAFALIGAGAAVGVIYKNLQKDKIQIGIEDQQKLELIKQYPELQQILDDPKYKDIFQSLTTKP